MDFSASYIYKSFFPQTGEFGIYSSFYINKGQSGVVDFSLSGTSGAYGLKFKSGQVLDNSNRFLGSYPYGKEFTVNTVFSQGGYDLYLNNSIVSAGSPIDPYSFERVSISSTGPTGYINTSVSGEVPTVSFSGGVMNNLGFVTGGIVKSTNSSLGLKIFDMTIDGDNSSTITSFPSSVYNSASFTLSGDAAKTGVYNEFFTAYTSAGVITGSLPVTRSILNTGNYLNFFPINDLNLIGTLNNNKTGIYVMSMNGVDDYPLIDFSLSYVSGAGTIYSQATSLVNGSGNISGNLVGSGYLNGSNISGYVTGATGNSLCFSSGVGSGFRYATGDVVYDYVASLVGSGYKGGTSGDTGIYFYLSTGLYTGSSTGTVTGQTSGSFLFNQNVSGLITSAISSAGPVTGSGYFTGSLNQAVVKTGYYEAHAPASFVGSCSYPSGQKTFFDTWSLETGKFLSSGYVNFFNTGWTGVNSYVKNPNPQTQEDGFFQAFARISYTSPYITAPTDVVQLNYSNGLRSGSVIITGQR